jgi:hypothetical protein
MGNGGSFSGSKARKGVADHSLPSSAEVKESVELYLHATHEWAKFEMHTEIQLKEYQSKRPLSRLRRRWDDNIKMNPRLLDVKVRIRFNWLRIRSNGGFL